MPTNQPRTIIMLAVLLLLPCASVCAIDSKDFDSIYNSYLALYNSQGKDQQFYDASKRLKRYYADKGNTDAYYTIQMNEALYETEHNRPHLAVTKANAMLLEIKKKHHDSYNKVYMTLGLVFESLGNYSMAEHYFRKGIDNTRTDDEQALMGAYSRMAYMLKFISPDRAREWNEKYAQLSLDDPQYRQVYLFINTAIAFTNNNRQAFAKAAQAYHGYRNEHLDLDNYGLSTIEVMEQAMAGNYEQAISQIDSTEQDLNLLSRYDLRQLVYRMQNRLDLALQTANERAWCVDSLNSDMLFNSINELNTQAGLAKMKSDSANERLHLLTAVLVLAMLLIALLAFFVYRHRISRQKLKDKNEQLRTALSMAEESDKMKTEFVRSVSHEIRTPLNAINGFNDIISNPDIHISAEERRDLVGRINTNIAAITNIVDEMLQMAEQGSNEFYPRTGSIYCNKFLSQILYSYRDTVNPDIELAYTTKVLNRFSFNTNQEGVKKIMEHLIHNAIKFTTKGMIEVNCRQSEDLKDVIITVSDTGCGVALENQDKIFEQFYKVDSFEQGIGLGLTVSRKIARKLGGDLTIDKDYTGGARFVLTLPFE